MTRRSARRRRRVLVLVAAPIAAALAAVAVWELSILRLHELADARQSRTIAVPVGNAWRSLVIGPANPYWTSLRAVSPTLVLCVVKAEDDGFFLHQGFDWGSLRESLETNVEEGEYVRGGSTITMQLARNLFLWRKKSLVRKALEAYLTWRLEQALPKRRILELYLNVVEWGPGIYGIGEASRSYFEKSPGELGIGESAMLAAILPNPVGWNPRRSPQTAMARQQALLGRLTREHALETGIPGYPAAER